MEILSIIVLLALICVALFGESRGPSGCKVYIPGFGYLDPADPRFFSDGDDALGGLVNPVDLMLESMLTGRGDYEGNRADGIETSMNDGDSDMGGDL